MALCGLVSGLVSGLASGLVVFCNSSYYIFSFHLVQQILLQKKGSMLKFVHA